MRTPPDSACTLCLCACCEGGPSRNPTDAQESAGSLNSRPWHGLITVSLACATSAQARTGFSTFSGLRRKAKERSAWHACTKFSCICAVLDQAIRPDTLRLTYSQVPRITAAHSTSRKHCLHKLHGQGGGVIPASLSSALQRYAVYPACTAAEWIREVPSARCDSFLKKPVMSC